MQPADVAIIGLACRFPGAVDPGGFWRVIRDGHEVTRAPGDDSEPETRGIRQREGLLANVAEFDADFFNVSPHEACAMDPRQRLALELTWELLEDAFAEHTPSSKQSAGIVTRTVHDQWILLRRERACDNYEADLHI